MGIIDQVAKKIAAGQRLSEDDALGLYETGELIEIGKLADEMNRRKNSDVAYFNVNRHINPTNICALSCKFCAYSRKPGEDGAYAYSIDEMVAKAGEAVAQGATEVHMVGGLHPRWRFEHYKDMIAAIKQAFPDLHLKAFTAVELDWLARKARKTIPDILQELQSVGLGSLPGGGAEIFHPEIRDAICDTKVPAEKWLDTHRQAHLLGMKSNSTMLYGHIENYFHRVDHMRRLRELQDETGGFNAFIPLSFQPFQNEMGINRYTFGYDDLKTIAIARLYLDNFRHIKAYWIMLGQDVAQLALQYGANDLDGTVIEEKISRAAGGRAGMVMSRQFITEIVSKAHRIPMERDTLYNPMPLREHAAPIKELRDHHASAHSDEITQLLQRSAAGETLETKELVRLAEAAAPFELANLGQQQRTQYVGSGDNFEAGITPALFVPAEKAFPISETITRLTGEIERCQEQFHLTPTSLVIDLAQAENLELGALFELIWALKQTFGNIAEHSLAGLKAIWQLAQREGVALGKVLSRLKEAGVDSIHSSQREHETDLTHGEVLSLHREIHALDIPTVAKVEVLAPGHGIAEPMWESFIKRVQALVGLQNETSGLSGLSIEVARDSFITGAEYMRAIAITRLAAPNIEHIVAPFSAIPTLSPPRGIGSASYQHPAEKIAPICLHYGASDLGLIDVTQLNPIMMMEQIRAAGFIPAVRDGRLSREDTARAPTEVALGLRHLPQLAIAGNRS